MALFTIHRNGTSKDEIVRNYRAVLEEIGELENAMRNAAPNARDYYVNDNPDDFEADRSEYALMLARLAAIKVWAEDMAVHAVKQEGN